MEPDYDPHREIVLNFITENLDEFVDIVNRKEDKIKELQEEIARLRYILKGGQYNEFQDAG